MILCHRPTAARRQKQQHPPDRTCMLCLDVSDVLLMSVQFQPPTGYQRCSTSLHIIEILVICGARVWQHGICQAKSCAAVAAALSRAPCDSIIVPPMTVSRAFVAVVVCVLSCDCLPVLCARCRRSVMKGTTTMPMFSGASCALGRYSLLLSYRGTGLDSPRFLDVGLDSGYFRSLPPSRKFNFANLYSRELPGGQRCLVHL